MLALSISLHGNTLGAYGSLNSALPFDVWNWNLMLITANKDSWTYFSGFWDMFSATITLWSYLNSTDPYFSVSLYDVCIKLPVYRYWLHAETLKIQIWWNQTIPPWLAYSVPLSITLHRNTLGKYGRLDSSLPFDVWNWNLMLIKAAEDYWDFFSGLEDMLSTL